VRVLSDGVRAALVVDGEGEEDEVDPEEDGRGAADDGYPGFIVR
jgi:hypothetical protein